MFLLSNDYVFHSRVSPFGDLGVMAFCELALVFVHLRPSSSSCAKASTLRPLFLDWKYCLLFSFFGSVTSFVQVLLDFYYPRFAAATPCALCRSGNVVLNEPDRLAFGGDKEIRTLDPLRARQVLSQLSYIPMFLCRCFIYRF